MSLHYMHYNFARPYKTLTTAAGGYRPPWQWQPALMALTEIAPLLD